MSGGEAVQTFLLGAIWAVGIILLLFGAFRRSIRLILSGLALVILTAMLMTFLIPQYAVGFSTTATLVVAFAAVWNIMHTDIRERREITNRRLREIIEWAMTIIDKVPPRDKFEGLANNTSRIRTLKDSFVTSPGKDAYVCHIANKLDNSVQIPIFELLSILKQHRESVADLQQIPETETEATIKKTDNAIELIYQAKESADKVINAVTQLMA
jgi:hypothetical protein